MGKNISKRIGSVIKLRPEYEERYIILHRHTFPGVLSQIKKVNIRNYSIFLLGGILFSYYEYIGTNFSEDMKLIADDVTKDWWKLTDPMQEPFPDRKDGEWWSEMKIILPGMDQTISSDGSVRFAFTASLIKNLDADIEPSLVEIFDATRQSVFSETVKNINLFNKNDKVYLYLECKSNEAALYFKYLNELITDNIDFRKLFITGERNNIWNIMKEVFHTN